MCNKVMRNNSWALRYVPDHLKTQDMCNEAVRDDPFCLQFVPDWFATQGKIKLWRDDMSIAMIMG